MNSTESRIDDNSRVIETLLVPSTTIFENKANSSQNRIKCNLKFKLEISSVSAKPCPRVNRNTFETIACPAAVTFFPFARENSHRFR